MSGAGQRASVAAQDGGVRAQKFEVRIIVESPANRQFQQRSGWTPDAGFLQEDLIALPRIVGRVVIAHHATVVDKVVLEQEFDGMGAEVPGG